MEGKKEIKGVFVFCIYLKRKEFQNFIFNITFLRAPSIVVSILQILLQARILISTDPIKFYRNLISYISLIFLLIVIFSFLFPTLYDNPGIIDDY